MGKILIYPFFLILMFFTHFKLIDLGVNLTLVPTITFFVCIIFIVLLEKRFTYRDDWNEDLGDYKTDIIQTLIILPTVAKALEIAHKYIQTQLSINIYSKNMSFGLQILIVVLASEFLFYWYHRLAHTNKFLMKYHAVHHGADRIYWANAGRFHIVDLILQFSIYFIPVYLLGASNEVAALFLTLNAVTGTLEHCNFDFKTIYIARIFNTAELHRVHHSKKISECNSNYGKILSIWDTVFNSYNKPKFKRMDFVAGLPGGRPVPYDLKGQFFYPYIKNTKKS